MVKRWIGLLVIMVILFIPGVVKADELPPGDDVIITAPVGIPLNPAELEPNNVEPPGNLQTPEIGIPLSSDEAAVPGNPKEQQPIPLPPVTPETAVPPAVQPIVTEKLLAEYTTKLINSPINRNHNINQALAAINEQVVKPGDIWSFNQTVGPRTAVRGYKKAMIIVNKKFVPGIGGGVCQVASTLYNVIMAAKLKVIERHPHSLPVKYVAVGRDAAVSYGIQDLKFVNNSPTEVIIRTDSQPGKVSIAFYTRQIEVAVVSPQSSQ